MRLFAFGLLTLVFLSLSPQRSRAEDTVGAERAVAPAPAEQGSVPGDAGSPAAKKKRRPREESPAEKEFKAGFAAREKKFREDLAAGAKEMVNPKDGSVLVLVPAGKFQMGSPDGEGGIDERPRHSVSLGAYYIGKYEVTVAQYRRFCREMGQRMPGQLASSRDDHPVVFVSWDDANAYCEWAGLRLPTEAEWEKAARGGTQTKYWWGNEATSANANFGREFTPAGGTAPIGGYPANAYGLHDTAGNVWEWCADRYKRKYYADSPEEGPKGPEAGLERVVRGGSWSNGASGVRPGMRYRNSPDGTYGIVGFRVAR